MRTTIRVVIEILLIIVFVFAGTDYPQIKGFWLLIFQAILSLGIFLGQQHIINKFNQRLEKYKKDLEKTSLEHQIRFSRLHEKRAAVIKNLHFRLITLEALISTTHFTIQLGEDLTKNIQRLDQYHDRFVEYIEYNGIYFTKQTLDTLNITTKTIDHFICCVQNYDQLVEIIKNKSEEKDKIRYTEKADWNINEVNITIESIKKLKEDLENEFRTLLGVN